MIAYSLKNTESFVAEHSNGDQFVLKGTLNRVPVSGSKKKGFSLGKKTLYLTPYKAYFFHRKTGKKTVFEFLYHQIEDLNPVLVPEKQDFSGSLRRCTFSFCNVYLDESGEELFIPYKNMTR